MTREQQIKDYVRDHYKYYGFYPYDVVLNMDTEQEETLTREEYMAIYLQKSTQCVPVIKVAQQWLLLDFMLL